MVWWIACYLAQRRGLRKVMIIEREEKLAIAGVL